MVITPSPTSSSLEHHQDETERAGEDIEEEVVVGVRFEEEQLISVSSAKKYRFLCSQLFLDSRTALVII
ncbi:hypothetical protein AKJ16_DCAP14714 [Drosera capensis]